MEAASSAKPSITSIPDDAEDKDGATPVANAVVLALVAADVQDKRPIAVGNTLEFEAASPGKWAGWLQVLASKRDASSFNLKISELLPGGATETFLNVSVANDNARRIDKVLENQSNLLRWKDEWPDSVAFPDFSKGIAVDPKNKPEEKQLGDTIGTAYLNLLQARNLNPDPLSAPVLAAKTEFDNAKKAALASVTDGNLLTKDVFLASTDPTGIYTLDQLYTRDGLFNLLCIPPYAGDQQDSVDVSVIAAAASYCEDKRAMLLVDPPTTWDSVDKAVEGINDADNQLGGKSKNAALFFPRIQQPNPFKDDQIEQFAPSGMIAGIFARTDTTRGVWKAPAGIEASLKGATSLSVPMTDLQNGLLNPQAVNCLRRFPVYGQVVWGSRTLEGADGFASDWKYVPVRRTALFIEESLFRGTKWVVFEPNDEPLWSQIRLAVGSFMHNLFRQGAFQGKSPRDAYFVKCDSETTTQYDINLGIVNIHVGFAPLKPCEFVVIQLQQMAGQIEV
jgi:phage tail sheath protein FI